VAKQVVDYPASAENAIYVMNLSKFSCTTETHAGGPANQLSDINDHTMRGHFRYSAKEDAFILATTPARMSCICAAVPRPWLQRFKIFRSVVPRRG